MKERRKEEIMGYIAGKKMNQCVQRPLSTFDRGQKVTDVLDLANTRACVMYRPTSLTLRTPELVLLYSVYIVSISLLYIITGK